MWRWREKFPAPAGNRVQLNFQEFTKLNKMTWQHVYLRGEEKKAWRKLQNKNLHNLYSLLGYGLDDQGFDYRQGLGISLFTTASRPALGPTQPPIQWVPGDLALGVKRPGREADHSLPSSAEVENAWAIPPLPLYAFVEWCSVRAQTTFTQILLWRLLNQRWDGRNM
jgi:hypothetical protein